VAVDTNIVGYVNLCPSVPDAGYGDDVSKYVALEGVDGSGKSTVGEALADRLRALGHDALTVREPGGTPLGEQIRELVLHSPTLDPWAEVFLFAAQRAELAREVVQPSLAQGTWVISDRSYYSSIAYQGRARGLGEETVRSINESGLAGVLPDFVFVLDVDPGVALERQEGPDRIGREGLDFQAAVRAAYLDLAEREEKVVVLSGSLSIGEMVDRMLQVIL